MVPVLLHIRMGYNVCVFGTTFAFASLTRTHKCLRAVKGVTKPVKPNQSGFDAQCVNNPALAAKVDHLD